MAGTTLEATQTLTRSPGRVLILCAGVVLSGALIPVRDARAQTVAGSTPGSFSVSPSGAATYTIPIQVPPGIAGVEPKLALSYNSQSGNGPLGMGWGLSGLSSIQRCPQTFAQDGVRGGVNFDANDRFCVDGQRLIPVSATVTDPSCSGTEYRTELESFTRVIACGSAGNGPASFKAWTKSGQIMEYGNTGDSRIEAVPFTTTPPGAPSWPTTTVRAWALNKISDRKGNYLKVAYSEDTVNGDYYPIEIDYTGNGAQSPGSSVQFLYETRTDAVPAYQAGAKVTTTLRLTHIKTFNGLPSGNNLIRDYQIAYDYNGAMGRSRISGVTECANGSCLPQTSFSWQTPPIDTLSPSTNVVPGSIPGIGATYNGAPGYMFTGDFDADGKTDYMWQTASGWSVAYSAGRGNPLDVRANLLLNNLPSGQATTNNGYMFSGDFDGDGKTDYMWQYGGWHVAYSTGRGTSFDARTNLLPPTLATGQTSYNPGYMFVGDFDGDGMMDYMWQWGSGWHVAYSTGRGSFEVHTGLLPSTLPDGHTTLNGGGYVFIGDFNGDGKADYMWQTGSGWSVAYSTGRGTPFDYHTDLLPASWPGVGPTYNAGYMLTGDFNGDGKTDYMWQYAGWHIAYSTGIGFDVHTNVLPATWPGLGQTYNPGYMLTGDFNGDGKTDYMWQYAGWHIAYSKGTSFEVHLNVLPPSLPGIAQTYNAGYMFAADFDGDGKTDYMWQYAGWHQAYPAVLYPDLVAQVTSGLGANTSITSTPITVGSPVYTKDTTAAYPTLDVQNATYVVSSVNASDGIGGALTASYKYGGLKLDRNGRGLLGFRTLDVTNPDSTSSHTEFRQDWPFIGMPSLSQKKIPTGGGPGNLVSSATNSYSCTSPSNGSSCAAAATTCTVAAGNLYLPYASGNVAGGYDLNGAVLPTVTTTTAYDTCGNATGMVASTGDGYSKTTTNIYATPDTANWFVGRLIHSTVTSVTP